MSGTSLVRLRAVVEPVVLAAGYDLDGLTLTPAGRRRLLQVVVDRDGGVSLDDVAALSPAVAAALDEADALPGGYVLEVTSPGVDRPLTEPRHWRRARGRLVRVALTGGGQLTGRVRHADDESVVVETADGPRRFRYAELGRGQVQVEFARRGAAEEGA